jgi:uncharacterized protein
MMGGLLSGFSGAAPLRGRAGLELIVHPFGYRDAARFWDITDPKLAVLVHSVVGGSAVWSGARARFLSQVTGPHFEAICRDYAIAAGPAVFGGPPGEVGSGVVPAPANRTQIQIDVAVLAPTEPGRPRKVLSLGEVKWDRVVDLRHVERLRRSRDLLAVKGFDAQHAVLTCYSGAGFDRELHAGQHPDIRLVGLDQLYAH